jgi:hypothetical protein
VAVIDTDFAGAAALVGKELPKNTVFIDLTAARNESIQPDPLPPGAPAVGGGTRLALAARLAAPDAGLVLIRVDPAAAYMLGDIARYLHGETFRPENMQARNRELLGDNERLRVERAKVTEERRAAAADFSQDEEAVKRRQMVAERSADLARQENEYLGRLSRFAQLEEDLIGLKTVRVVVCPLAWDIGYPVDGSGPLSRYLDDVFYGRPQPHKYGQPRGPEGPTLWFQAAGNTRGQVWNDALRDADGNSVFEFGPPTMPLPVGRWSREVNFLEWQPEKGDRAADLPAGAKIRVALQWTEAHDPQAGEWPGPDPYRTPLADVRLLVLRQRDPSGRRVATDDFNVVARSDRLPQLIDRAPNSATYEYIVEFALDGLGRYALRLEGTVPPTIRLTNLPTIPAIERTWEPHARLFVEVTDVGSRDQGRPVFGDFMPGLGGLGMPGDAVLLRTIGAIDGRGQVQPYSASGAGAGRELLAKPSFYTFDELPLPRVPAGAGTEQAAAFAAGMAASMLSAGAPISQELRWLCIPPGGVLRVPPAWLEQIERRWPKTGRE